MNISHEKIATIKLDAAGLDIGESDNDIPCPDCGEKKSFGVVRVAEGLVYNCLRVSCGAKGFIPMVGSSNYDPIAAAKRQPLVVTNPYLGATSSLPASVVSWLSKKYELPPDNIREQGWTYDSKHHRLIMTVTSYFGYEFGVVAKKLPKSTYKGGKAINYFSRQEPVKLAFSKTSRQWIGGDDTIVLVEDMISAAKVARFMQCAALLGTNLTHKQIAFLATHYKNVYMMLDPDAIGKSLLYSKQYGSLFNQFRVISLKADPKDTTYSGLAAELMNLKV